MYVKLLPSSVIGGGGVFFCVSVILNMYTYDMFLKRERPEMDDVGRTRKTNICLK